MTNISWFNDSVPEAARVGYVQDSAVGDVDGDGQAELVTVGIFAHSMGDVRVIGFTNGTLETKAAIMWQSPTYWEFRSVLLRDIDGDNVSEIIAGGIIRFGVDEGAPGIQVFRLNGTELVPGESAWWSVGIGKSKIIALLSPSVEDSANASFVSASMEFGDNFGAHAFLYTWVRLANGTLERTREREINAEVVAAVTVPCAPRQGRAQGYVLAGPYFVSFLAEDGFPNGSARNTEYPTPEYLWKSLGCLDGQNQTVVVAVGQGNSYDNAGPALLGFTISLDAGGAPFFRAPESESLPLSVAQRASVGLLSTPALKWRDGQVRIVFTGTAFSSDGTTSWLFSSLLDPSSQSFSDHVRVAEFVGAGFEVAIWATDPSGVQRLLLSGGGLDGRPIVMMSTSGSF